jgi:hypothetical protein
MVHEWNIGNSRHIPGGYVQTDSPLSAGFITTGTALNATNPSGSEAGIITGYTSNGGPVWKGTVPVVKDANSFKQWFNDDSKVNKTFTGVLELPAIGTNIYQYASKTHLAPARDEVATGLARAPIYDNWLSTFFATTDNNSVVTFPYPSPWEALFRHALRGLPLASPMATIFTTKWPF